MQVSISLQMLRLPFCAYIILLLLKQPLSLSPIIANFIEVGMDSSSIDYVILICLPIYCPVNQLIVLESLLFHCMF